MSAVTRLSLFFINKGFHPRINFRPDNTTAIYELTQARLQAAKANDITRIISRVLEYIRTRAELAGKTIII